MAQDKKVEDTEKYQGPGKITTTFSGAAAGSSLGAIAFQGLALSGAFEKMIGSGKGANTKTYALFAGLIAIPAIIGGWMGFAGADKGKKQFEAAKAERDEARGHLGQAAQMVQGLQMQNQAMQHEVVEGRKRFTEGLKSLADHGGHAAAADASMLAAAQAEAGR